MAFRFSIVMVFNEVFVLPLLLTEGQVSIPFVDTLPKAFEASSAKP